MNSNRSWDMLLTGLAPALWGTTYIVTTEWLPVEYPLFIAMMRALPVGVFLCLSLRQWPSGVWWWRSAVLGLLNIGLFFALLFLAAGRLPGGLPATIGAIQPLFVVALAWGILKERPTLRRLGLASLGLGGVALLVLASSARLDPLGVLAICGAAAAMATGTVLAKKWGRPVGLLSFTAWQLATGGVMLLFVTLIVEGAPPAVTPQQGLGFLYLAAMNTGLAYALWFRGIERLPATALPMLGLLSPVVALLLGYALLHQRLGLLQLLGVALVLGSVLLSQRGRRNNLSARRTLSHRERGRGEGLAKGTLAC
jgi:probable blue pigment (indigoidine) exporter